jgi:FlaA1/EpsC-like NDP-sugar epimerase
VQTPLIMRNRILLIGDLFFIVASVLGSFVLRLNLGARLADFIVQILVMIGISLIIKPLVYFQFGLYRRIWAYASIQELKLISIAVTTASILLSVVITILSITIFKEFPRSVLVIDWLLSLISVGGLRLASRIIAEGQTSPPEGKSQVRQALIIGAGDAGALVAREMRKNPQGNLVPVGIIDDDVDKQNQEIHGVQVIGTISDLPRIIDTHHIDEVIIAIPSAPGSIVRTVTEICRLNNIPSRTMPSLFELIGGKVSVNRLREVDITDLLRRKPAHIDSDLVGLSLGDRRVLITGAGGSIGRELCRQVSRWEPSELILLGHGENSIFETLVELEQTFPSMPIHPVIADIRDEIRLERIFKTYEPQFVFHTAAHKHLPLMQANIEEAITNNVLGTQNVIKVALKSDTDKLIMISTDKAIRPTSVYGATKRLGEMIVLDAANQYDASFSIVRFGNVLGSRGSVLLLFKQQLLAGGPVTVTHPEMMRYFMTIPEAVHLVLQASAMGHGGEVFVLNMGEQIKILDLAEDLIRLSGLEPGKDIDIVFTGIRPGEKLSEALWDEGADYHPTTHPDILTLAEDEILSSTELFKAVDELIRLAKAGETEAIIDLLDNIVPGASVFSASPADMTALV